jgi:hypothetical protein
MSPQTWTIDAIAHALPHPELRQTFMRETHLAPIGELEAVLDRWIRFVEEFEAGRPRIEALRAHVTEHGQLPPEYAATLVEITPDELQVNGHRARGAA